MSPVPLSVAFAVPPQGRFRPASLAPVAVPQGKLSGKPVMPEQRPPLRPERAAALAETEQAALLAERCRKSDSAAWAELVRTQNRRIYALCYRFTSDAADAEDLTQDVFLKVHRNLASFDASKGSFQTWLTTLARNLLVDHFRRSRNDRSTDSLDANWDASDDDAGPSLATRIEDTRPSAHAQAANNQLSGIIQQALSQLSPELREAVILRDLQDFDYKDIAEVLKVPEGTVKSRISRGRAELARLLERMKGQVM
jgi:RNA polymerase sigma-70 factor (ECF subfamily)